MTASSPRRRGRLVAVAVAVLAILAAGCDGAHVNAWRRARGMPELDAATADRVAQWLTAVEAEIARRKSFVGEVLPVSAERLGVSWRPGCPVGPESLRLLRVSHVGYDGSQQVGEIVVHRDVAGAVVAIFRLLFDEKFPIERMRTVEAYGADDDASMADNNTSGFNCRFVAGGSSWSMHAYGRAIDLNPVVNPYVNGWIVDPPAGAAHLDRASPAPGKVTPGSIAVVAFGLRGWRWGGLWSGAKDYQHFSTNGR
jgi:hypothetical protein